MNRKIKNKNIFHNFIETLGTHLLYKKSEISYIDCGDLNIANSRYLPQNRCRLSFVYVIDYYLKKIPQNNSQSTTTTTNNNNDNNLHHIMVNNIVVTIIIDFKFLYYGNF